MAKLDVTLNEEYFGLQPNVPLMHQVVTAQLAKRRAGTQSTKTRSEVRGGGAKPFRQKGTGRARQGSTNAPHYAGGGVALGPKPRSYAQRTPKKMIKLALRSALSDRAAGDRVLVVDAFGWAEPSTKQAVKALDQLGVAGRTLVVLEREDAIAALSFRNLPEVQLINVGELNAYDVLCNDWIVFTQSALRRLNPLSGEDADAGDETSVDAANVAPSQSAEVAAADDAVAASAATPRGFVAAASAVDEGVSRAAGFDIKGNADSMLYHVPGSRWYDATEAEEWFDTEEAAQAAGYSKAGAGGRRAGFDIKGNADSMLYHVPGSRWYDATEAEEWFDTEEAAQAAGYSKAGGQREES